MIHHCRAVTATCHAPLVIGDLPFGSYLTPEMAAANACRLLKEGRVEAVKLEGGRRSIPQIEACVRNGISVFGHIGLTPQVY